MKDAPGATPPMDDKERSAVLTPRTAISRATANFENLQGQSAAGAMAALVALGQKGALGHSLGEQFRARTMSDRRLENFAHGEKSSRAIGVEGDGSFRHQSGRSRR